MHIHVSIKKFQITHFFESQTFQGKGHELVTLEFRDKIQDIIAESDALRAQPHKERVLNEKIRTLKQKINQNNDLLDQQQKLFEKYPSSPKDDIRKSLYERQSDYARQLENLSSIHEKLRGTTHQYFEQQYLCHC